MNEIQILGRTFPSLFKGIQTFLFTSACILLPLIAITGSVDLRNVAIGKPAAIDSLYEPSPSVAKAEHAVDGDSSKTNLWSYSCAHSGENSDFPKWWVVDLLKEYDIREVLITNRDSYEGRLRNFTIDVFKQHPNAISGFPNILGQECAFQPGDGTFPGRSVTKKYTCNQPLKGRYVRVVKYGYWALVMCEVQVMSPAYEKNYYATRHSNVKANRLPYDTQTNARSYTYCASLCALDDDCNSFHWKEALQECGLYKLSPYISPTFAFVAEPGTDLTLNFEIGG